MLQLAAIHAFAQSTDIQPVKDGDRLGIKYTVFGEKSKGDIFEQRSENYLATFVLSPTEYSIKYDAGRIDTYNSEHTIIRTVSRGRTTNIPKEEQTPRIPKDLSPGKKENYDYWFNAECGRGKVVFENIFVEDGTRNIKINGVEKQIPVQVISQKGRWFCAGTGRHEFTVVFSKQLNLILERKLLSYDRQDFLFPFSDSRKIESIN